MDELAFSMQIVECKENMLESYLELDFGEPMNRAVVEQVGEIPPHGFQDKAAVVPALTWKGEYIESGHDAGIPAMPPVGLAYLLISLELRLICCFARINFQSHEFVRSVDLISCVQEEKL